MTLVKIKNIDLILDQNSTYLTTDTAAAVGTLSVKNITGFAINQLLLLGFLNFQGSEIVKTHASTAPSGSTITLAANSVYPHSASTSVTVIGYDQVEISVASTTTGSKTVLGTISISVDDDYTIYNDTSNSTGYYFARFKNSITSGFSAYSDPIPNTGYTQFSARTIIDNSLDSINKKTSSTFSDAFGFKQIDNCQMECLREFKRWSFMQKFDANIGTVYTGTWRLPLPADCDDQNTTKSIYNFRIGKGSNVVWVDKEKWNELLWGMAHTTLLTNILINDITITLTDSSSLNDSGVVLIGGNYYTYTANDRTTGILNIPLATTTAIAGLDTFQGATMGTPQYWTTFGGFIYFYPLIDPTLDSRDAYMDYYTSLVQTTTDSQKLIIPDPVLAQYYLTEQFLLRQNSGEPTLGSDEYHKKFLTRLDTMKKKESINRTVMLKPRLNKFRMNDEDSRSIRTGSFPYQL